MDMIDIALCTPLTETTIKNIKFYITQSVSFLLFLFYDEDYFRMIFLE